MSRPIFAAISSACGHVIAVSNDHDHIAQVVFALGRGWFLSIGISDAELDAFLADEKCATCTVTPDAAVL